MQKLTKSFLWGNALLWLTFWVVFFYPLKLSEATTNRQIEQRSFSNEATPVPEGYVNA
jgi:hypothetical protein